MLCLWNFNFPALPMCPNTCDDGYILSHSSFDLLLQRAALLATFAASANAFAPAFTGRANSAVFAWDPNPAPKSSAEALEKGWSLGGKAHTKDPAPVNSNDPRLVIPKAVSFEEYMKQRGNPAAAAAPVKSSTPAYAQTASPIKTSAPVKTSSYDDYLKSRSQPAATSSYAPAASTAYGVDPNPAPKDNAEALEKGWSLGGKAHTKDPAPVNSNDPRLVIPKAESFEEYMKRRANPAAAAAPVKSSTPAYAPARSAPANLYFAEAASNGVDPNPAPKSNAEALEKGWSLGGKAHTKDPAPVQSSDPRLVIPKAESFEEYMKRRRS